MKTRGYLLSTLAFFSIVGCDGTKNTSAPANDVRALGPVAEGQERGNGTDTTSIFDQSSLFTGKGRIFKYCVEVHPDFGVDRPRVLATIVQSLSVWKDYSAERSWHQEVTFDGQLESTCTADTDLKFQFGEARKPFDVNDLLTGHAIGHAYRDSFDFSKSWGKGRIFIVNEGAVNPFVPNPNWQGNQLNAVVLHELGHIFGVEHVAETVMDEKLGDIVGAPRIDTRQKFLGQIDGFRDLLPPPNEKAGTLGVSKVQDPNLQHTCLGDESENFKALTGRIPTGAVTAKLLMLPKNKFALQINDSLSRERFGLEDYSWAARYPIRNTDKYVGVFRAARYEQATGQHTFPVNWHETFSREYKLKTKTGSQISVSFEQNLNFNFFVDVDDVRWIYTATGTTLIRQSQTGPRLLFTTSVYGSALGATDGVSAEDCL
jgi:hypothetical protein